MGTTPASCGVYSDLHYERIEIDHVPVNTCSCFLAKAHHRSIELGAAIRAVGCVSHGTIRIQLP